MLVFWHATKSFTEQKYWGVPPIIKIPEAIGALADERVELVDDSHAKVY